MAKQRKPRPKTQKEISNNLRGPYSSEYGDPNNQDTTNESTTGQTFKRSKKLSYKGDKSKPFNIGLQDIDEALFHYIREHIKPTVEQNGEKIPVPIEAASQERWVSMRKQGGYRDKKGALMLPIMVLKRDNIKKDRSKTNKLDSNKSGLYTSFQTSYTQKNMYSNFIRLNNRVPVRQFQAVVIPDFVKVTYSVTIQTYYVEQLNKIVEAIEFASDSYWGDPERFRFKAFADDFNTIVEIKEGEDRVVKSTFNIRLNGYIIPDTIQKDLSSLQKFNTKSKIIIQMETTSNEDIFDINVEKLPDGRTRKERKIEGRITSAGDVVPVRQIKDADPGSELRE